MRSSGLYPIQKITFKQQTGKIIDYFTPAMIADLNLFRKKNIGNNGNMPKTKVHFMLAQSIVDDLLKHPHISSNYECCSTTLICMISEWSIKCIVIKK